MVSKDVTLTQAYAHPELYQEVVAIGGHYVLIKEVRLPFRGREILYLVGRAAFETTCCGVGGCAYALVPGFIVEWKGETNADGLPVSQLEPIRDKALQVKVRRLIEDKETVHQVLFQ
jgi:hypothetical protein